MSSCAWREYYGNKHFKPGIYVCSKCKYELFSSRSKFKHHTPWPAFNETIHNDSVIKELDSRCETPDGVEAFKVKCGKCGNKLGHEFLKDGPKKSSRF